MSNWRDKDFGTSSSESVAKTTKPQKGRLTLFAIILLAIGLSLSLLYIQNIKSQTTNEYTTLLRGDLKRASEKIESLNSIVDEKSSIINQLETANSSLTNQILQLKKNSVPNNFNRNFEDWLEDQSNQMRKMCNNMNSPECELVTYDQETWIKQQYKRLGLKQH